MSDLQSFHLFPSLPLEIRRKIWFHSLQTPRLLKLQISHPSHYNAGRNDPPPSNPSFKVVPASSGGVQNPLLSVNQESRIEALLHLVLLHGMYWNLDVDIPYFEIKDDADANITAMAEFARVGDLVRFRHVAVDWNLWGWGQRTRTMEFRVTFGRRFEGWSHPITILNTLPNIQTCTFVYRKHTLEKDLVISYKPWHLGPLTADTTLTSTYDGLTVDVKKKIEGRREELKREHEVQLDVLSVHDREREYLPPDRRMQGLQGWQMDWFG